MRSACFCFAISMMTSAGWTLASMGLHVDALAHCDACGALDTDSATSRRSTVSGWGPPPLAARVDQALGFVGPDCRLLHDLWSVIRGHQMETRPRGLPGRSPAGRLRRPVRSHRSPRRLSEPCVPPLSLAAPWEAFSTARSNQDRLERPDSIVFHWPSPALARLAEEPGRAGLAWVQKSNIGLDSGSADTSRAPGYAKCCQKWRAAEERDRA